MDRRARPAREVPAVDRRLLGAASVVERRGRRRPAGPQPTGRRRRLRRRLSPRGRADAPAGLEGRGPLRHLAAQRHRHALHLALRHGRAEGALAAASAVGRTGRRHRHDRAGRGLRPARDQDHRHQVGRPLCPERLQDLHHQRPAGQLHHRRRQDRPGRRRQGHQPDLPRNGRGRGLRARPQPAQDRHGGQRHLRALLQRRQGAAGERHRRRRGPGLRPADAATAAGTPEHRGSRRGRRRARAGGDAGLRQAAQGLR